MKMKIQDEGEPEPVPSTTEAHAGYETNRSFMCAALLSITNRTSELGTGTASSET